MTTPTHPAPSPLAYEVLSEHACFGGRQLFIRHQSQATALPMRVGLYLPPQAQHSKVPVLLYLAGLTCNEETFFIKAGAQALAAHYGLALVCPDTSPRDAAIADEAKDWDFGLAASFYLDATQTPWQTHYRMQSYCAHELPAFLAQQFAPSLDLQRLGLCGHSMGGHGALTLAQKFPATFRSLSAFAPIVAPSQVPWGHKAFRGYLGPEQNVWQAHDACALMLAQGPLPAHYGSILIDQGLNDKFLTEQLQPERFESACQQRGQSLVLRRHAGYDHGYYFVASFMADHIRHHAALLLGAV